MDSNPRYVAGSTGQNDTSIMVRVPEPLKHDYRQVARKLDLSLAQLTRKAMREIVERHMPGSQASA